jgi:sirohydrochlorin cobaltochelatase
MIATVAPGGSTAVDERAFEALQRRIRTLLPARYQDTYEAVKPVPMRSAALKYDLAGQVAWDQMWGSFCDLAMAGGPPHKGALLEPGRESDIDADFDRYDEVVEEICRGIRMVTGLRAYPSQMPGWVSVTCLGDAMAGWLVRAIVMENVAARHSGAVLELPAAPHFRLEREIKNVITVVAKTCHYWVGHVPRDQQQAIGELLVTMARQEPLLQPAWSPDPSDRRDALAGVIASAIEQATDLRRAERTCDGWLGLECGDVSGAISMMRALVASNVLARREGTALFVPVNPATDPRGVRVAHAVAGVHRLSSGRHHKA